MRFYDPQQGRLLLDGVDIRKLTLSSLREQISVVLQEPLLFSGTILRQHPLRPARGERRRDRRGGARRRTRTTSSAQLPKGYETELGERGAQLSGGERQRICVARAFLKDAPILILDEPTSSIDSKTEAVILDALDRLAEGRTTFMVAHRLSTIRHADLILVIDHGQPRRAGHPRGAARARGPLQAALRRSDRPAEAATRRARGRWGRG